MIKREYVSFGDVRFIKTFSDEGFIIERDGYRFAEAIDPIEYEEERIYFETDEKIQQEFKEEEEIEEELILEKEEKIEEEVIK